VGLVCEQLGRAFTGIELGAHNVTMAEARIAAARTKGGRADVRTA
jgi:DNA modification methylase